MRKWIKHLLVLLGLFIAACSVTDSLPSSQPAASPLPTMALTSPLRPPAAPTLTFASPAGAPASTWPADADAAVRAALQDLAAQRRPATNAVQVQSVEPVDWPNTSLGCPQPGMFYAQVITPGYRIVLADGGQTVEYHSDKKGRVVTCK